MILLLFVFTRVFKINYTESKSELKMVKGEKELKNDWKLLAYTHFIRVLYYYCFIELLFIVETVVVQFLYTLFKNNFPHF